MKRGINLHMCLSAFNVATPMYDSWLGVKGSNLKPYESESSALPIAPTPNILYGGGGEARTPAPPYDDLQVCFNNAYNLQSLNDLLK